MNGHKASLYIVLAFIVGAIFPLLGLLAAAAVGGAIWATRTPRTPRMCDPKLMEDIREYELAERAKLKEKRR